MWLLLSICYTVGGKASDSPPGFPAPLTLVNFASELKQGLHLVEFYSPYCSHCNSLAPIWEKTWESFHEEGEKLNITMSQVNCIESGDICAKENIEFYPNLRLYGPNGFIKNFSGKRKAEAFIEFMKTEAADPSNTEVIDSQSVALTGHHFAKLLAGASPTRYLVSFWPSEDISHVDEKIQFKNCRECSTFSKAWGKLSEKLKEFNIATGHLNCQSNELICKELGFANLLEAGNDGANREPRIALLVPNKTTNNFFVYENPLTTDIAVYEEFAKRLYSNNEVPELTEIQIMDIINKNFAPLEEQKLHLVFNYDVKTVFPEDFDILEYLIEPLSKIPNMYLYKSVGDLRKVTHSAFEEMYGLINYNETEAEKSLNEDAFALNTITQTPTFYLFKDGDKIPHVFPGYSTTEMRNLDAIMQWVNEYATPLITQVTESNFEDLLGSTPSRYSNVIIVLTDSSRPKEQIQNIKDLFIGYYDYEHIRQQNMFQLILDERNDKERRVAELKSQKAQAERILNTLRKEIPHTDDKAVILTYVDIAKQKDLLSNIGINSHLEHKAGDVIMIDRKTGFFYELNTFGSTLTSSPYEIKDTLRSLNFPGPSIFKYVKHGKLINSPYNGYFEHLNVVHRHGIWGYIVVGIIMFSLFKLRRAMTAHKIKERYNSQGLLGVYHQKKPLD